MGCHLKLYIQYIHDLNQLTNERNKGKLQLAAVNSNSGDMLPLIVLSNKILGGHTLHLYYWHKIVVIGRWNQRLSKSMYTSLRQLGHTHSGLKPVNSNRMNEWWLSLTHSFLSSSASLPGCPEWRSSCWGVRGRWCQAPSRLDTPYL